MGGVGCSVSWFSLGGCDGNFSGWFGVSVARVGFSVVGVGFCGW